MNVGCICMNNIEKSKLANFPKVELHVHLEGAIRRDTLQEYKRRFNHNYLIKEQAWIQKNFRYDDLPHFLKIMQSTLDKCLMKPQEYERVAYEYFKDLADQNVRYAEVSFDPLRGLHLGMSLSDIIKSINRAKQRIKDEKSIEIRFIAGLGRKFGPKIVHEFVENLLEFKNYGINGIDIHGDEKLIPNEAFADTYELAKKSGLGLRAHAGESENSKSIWNALLSLGVSRIGHGISSIVDDKLIEFLIKKKVTLDICPTSNLKLRIVPSISSHPIRKLYDLGVRVTVSTDDPLFFNTSITDEYNLLMNYFNFTYNDLKKITLNAIDGSFLLKEEKRKLKFLIEKDLKNNEII